MKEIKRPHDSFFKRLMSDERVVREFLRSFLPEELAHAIDYNSVRIADTEKISRSGISIEQLNKIFLPWYKVVLYLRLKTTIFLGQLYILQSSHTG